MAKPLYDVMGPSATFSWGTDQAKAFDALRQKLMEAPVLAYPNSEDLFILDTDASNHAIGAELLQAQNGVERLIGFGSFVLDSAQRNYCTTRKELLAVVRCTRHFKHYLLGRRFTLRTDHNSLLWLMGFKNIEGQLARWIEELAVYNMEIVHRPGKDHVNADGLSRIPDPLVQCNYYSYGCDVQDLPCGGCKYCVRANEQWDRFHEDVDDIVPLAVRHIAQDESDTEPHEDVTWVEKYTTQDLRKMQLEDDTTAQIIRWLEDDHKPSQAELALASPAIKYFWLLRRKLIVLSGVVYYQRVEQQTGCAGNRGGGVLVAPEPLQRIILEHCHDKPGAGHMGMNKTTQRVKRYAIWYKMLDSCVVYVRSCSVCNRQKKPQKKPKAHQVQYHAGSPLERIHIDILGPLIETPRGNQYVLVVVDQFAKWVECYALADQTAERVSRTLVSEFIGRFGCPLELHSDQGRNFESRMFKEVCDLLKIVKTRTTPYRPSANGQVERMNRTILQILRCFIQGQQEDWDLHLATVGMAIRSTVNRQTGFTPNFLMLGREVLQPIDLMLNPGCGEEQRTPGTYAARHQEAMRTAHREARLKRRQKRDYDLRLEERKYSVDDAVYRFNRSIVLGQSKKLQPIWSGPWIVTQVISSVLYRIANRKRSMVAHHDSLKLCSDRDLPIWLLTKRHELKGEDVGDRVPEQATDALGDEHGNGDDLGLENLFAEMTEEGLEQRSQTQDMPYGDEVSPDVLNDDDPELFEDYIEIDDAQRENTRTRGGRVIKRPTHLDDYGV